MTKINTIKDMAAGTIIEGVYVVENPQYYNKASGDFQRIALSLRDGSGVVRAVLWEKPEENLTNGQIIKIKGSTAFYNDAPQITVLEVKEPTANEYNPDDLYPATKADRKELEHTLAGLINSVENEFLNKLLKCFFGKKVFWQEFREKSAAVYVHHAFCGGLLEHTVNVAQLCDAVAKTYSDVDRDLLVTGGLLHDIGKMKEISNFPENIFTEEGNLLGHISLGALMIHDAIIQITEFPKELEMKLMHMILSHHGELEYGSPVKPAIKEAVILSNCDQLDASLETAREAIDLLAPGETKKVAGSYFIKLKETEQKK